MRRAAFFALAASLLPCRPAPLGAQLPTLTAPVGALRIELGGAFHPVGDILLDGNRQPLAALIGAGALLDGGATPLVAEVDARLRAILGAPVAGAALGRVAANAEWQRGIGTIGLALGVTRRITAYANVPIVSTRTQVDFRFDTTGATLGINPADPELGSSAGANQTAAFFAEYDAALSELATRVGRGDYSGDPAQLARAQQLLTNAPLLRAGLFELLADPFLSSPVLPTAASAAGQALADRIAAVRTAFNDDFAIAFTSNPALPSAPVDGAAFEALLDAGTAYGYTPRNVAPRVALGDIEAGVVVEAFRSRRARTFVAGWLRGAARFPTGDAPASTTLLDQGSGDHQLDIEIAATVEIARSRFGVRAEGSYTRQQAAEGETRVGSPRQALLPARYRAAVRVDPGDIVTFDAQPYFRLADRLAITALLQYARRGADAVQYVDGQQPIAGADLNDLISGTASNATRLGLGLSYAHDGRHRDGEQRLPVEASLSVERTVGSSNGIVPAALTSRVRFRVYKRLW